jgi:Zn-dependent protease
VDTPRGGIKLGTFAGAPVILAPSWFLIAFFVIVTFAPTVRDFLPDLSPGAEYVVAATYALLLLASVLVHELAHAVVARSFGLSVSQIVANLWGGHTQFGGESTRPGPSAAVAVAGPIANLALAGVGWIVRGGQPTGVISLLGAALFYANGLLAIFNLLPGLPLDGGRVVESLIWAISGQRSLGTFVAGWCGRVVAVLVVGWGIGLPLLQGDSPNFGLVIWAGLIAALLWSGATQALTWAAMRRRAAGVDARSMSRPAVPVYGDWTVAEVDELARTQGVPDVVVLDPGGVPCGTVSAADVRAMVASGRPDTQVQSLIEVIPPYAVLPAATTGEELLQLLARAPAAPTYALVDEHGAVALLAGRDLVMAMGLGVRS